MQIKILLSAYACEPGAGSEYGVGWNVALHLAQKHEVYVLTRSHCREKIEIELDKQSLPGLKFLFYDIPDSLFYKKEMGSNWGEQYNYLLWQLYVRNFAKKMNKKFKFDLIHHLTFNQYRTPSPGFFLDIPFVMGPIGGAETIAPCFYADLLEHTAKKETIRKKGKDLVVFGWLINSRKNKKHILCSTNENVTRLSPYVGDAKISLLPAIAFDPKDFTEFDITSQKSKTFEMIYAGKAYDWKGIYIYLKASKRAFIDNGIYDFKIKLIGIRFEEEQKLVMDWVTEQGLIDNVELIPFMERASLLKMMTSCNLSIYPAFRDSGSMSVLEACVLGCPTICFNAGGQDAFPADILLKVPVGKTYKESLNAFAEKLLWAYNNPDHVSEIGLRARDYVYEHFTWNKKIDDFEEIYKNLLEK